MGKMFRLLFELIGANGLASKISNMLKTQKQHIICFHCDIGDVFETSMSNKMNVT